MIQRLRLNLSGFFLLFLFLIFQDLCAGHFTFIKYTQASGLVSNYIFDLYQDRDGFIWVATDRGLSRFDGRTFRNFTRTDGLSANHVYTIFQDEQGGMWFGTYDGGVVHFTGQSVQIIAEQDGLASNTVLHITQDRFGRLYFMTEKGLTVFKDSVLISFQNHDHLSGNLYRHPSGTLFFNLDNRLFRLNPTEKWPLNPEQIPLTPAQSEAISKRSWASPVLTGNDLLYPGRNQYLQIRLTEKADITDISVIDQACFALLSDHEGRLWLARNHGLEITGSGRKFFVRRESGLDPDYIEALLEDFEGNIWLGTMGGGLYKYKGDHLTWYTKTDGLISDFVNTIFVGKTGQVLAGTMQGLCRIGPDNKIENLRLESHTREIISLYQDKNGQYYAGTYQELYGPFEQHWQITNRRRQVHYIPAGVSSICVGADQDIWVSTFGDGVIRLREGRQERLTKADGLPANVIEEIIAGPGSLWFLSRESGAARLAGDSLQLYNRSAGLPSDAIYSLLEEEDGQIWFGTDRGLARFYKNQVNVFALSQGLTGNYVMGIFRIKNRLLIVTDRALHYLQDGQIRVYAGSALLPATEVHLRRVFYSAETGALWLATNSGAIRVDLERMEERCKWLENRPPSILIKSVFSDTTCLYSYRPAPDSAVFPAIELKPKQNNLRFCFTGISFLGETPVQYSYRLDGYDRGWSDYNSRDEAIYTRLPGGNYTFQVKAVNSAGIESLHQAAFTFRIKPPYREQAWFLIPASVLGIIALIVSGFMISNYGNRKKIHRLQQEKALQEERQKTRESIASELHDDVSSTLSSISLLTDSLKRRLKLEPEKSELLLNQLSDLTHEAQETMEEVVWSLSSHHDTLRQLILRICDFACEYCANNDLLCKTELLENDQDFPISELTRKSIFLIVKEAMHNIIKHARASQVILRIGLSGDDFLLEISDNGVGFDQTAPARNHRIGHGLTNMKSRARQIQARFELNSASGRGTQLVLRQEITQMGH